MKANLRISQAKSALEQEQARDLRRSVLCGELHWPREAVQDGLDPDCDLYVAWDSEKPVATLRLRPDSDGAWLELMAVLPAYRGQGLGRELIGTAASRCAERGLERLSAVVPRELELYFLKHGFTVKDTQNGLNLMEKCPV